MGGNKIMSVKDNKTCICIFRENHSKVNSFLQAGLLISFIYHNYFIYQLHCEEATRQNLVTIQAKAHRLQTCFKQSSFTQFVWKRKKKHDKVT